MKIYLLILIILLFAGCKNQQRSDKIAFVHNFITPEILSFELDAPELYPPKGLDASFAPNEQDGLLMYPLDRESMIRLLEIEAKVCNIYFDSLHYDDNTRFFVFGKLDLQSDVESIVLWKFVRNPFQFNDFLEKSFWLFNIKEGKVCSVARLEIVYGAIINLDGMYNYSDVTYLKDRIFTVKSTKYRLPFWTHFRADPVGSIEERITGVDEYYTHYYVDNDGFIKFIDK